MPNILLVSATKLEHHDKELFGIPIHIIGVGKVEAALNVKKLIEDHKLAHGCKPSHIINFGSCGNLQDHKVGEVLEVGTVWDNFYTGTTGIPTHPPIQLSDSGISLFTTDLFYNTEETYHESSTYYLKRCNLVDMEGYSIAKVCKAEKISLSLYKWISDDGSHSDWLANAAIGYKNFKVIFKRWLEQQK
jgi:adenosylhomocysteine nucleosidase